MKYCPNCKRDFEDSVKTCQWCEVDLVDTLDEQADALKEKGEELENPDGGITGEKVCIWNSFDVLTIAKIEKWLKDAGIPVEVRQSVPLNDDGDEDVEDEEAVEEAEEEAEAVEEVEEEDFVPFYDTKKSFFARLFHKHTQEKLDKEYEERKREYKELRKKGVVGIKPSHPHNPYNKSPDHDPEYVYEEDLFDVFVPDELKDEALRILNESFGIIGAEGYGIDNEEEVE